jgi:hypothetical protein
MRTLSTDLGEPAAVQLAPRQFDQGIRTTLPGEPAVGAGTSAQSIDGGLQRRSALRVQQPIKDVMAVV